MLCGKADRICPEGSGLPIIVGPGNYTDESERESSRSMQYPCPLGYYCPGDGYRHACPSGSYGGEYGLTSPSCSGYCYSGYYCNEHSPSPTQYPCGNSTVYCPTGSAAPSLAHSGFYTIATGTDANAINFWDKTNSTQSAEIPCEPGYYCDSGVKYPCPPGTFGWRYGLNTSTCSGLCAAGYYCPSYLIPQPDAPSHATWPMKPHTAAAELECGDVRFFCPMGSYYPNSVGSGNYTVGGGKSNTTRTGQNVCESGTFCSNGISLQCPKGKYGNATGLSSPECSGWCIPGHYCPEGTGVPIPCPQNSYAMVRMCCISVSILLLFANFTYIYANASLMTSTCILYREVLGNAVAVQLRERLN